ncbi:MAG: hypothetical protein K6V97_14090 [Actinomycetia bacterium]|nr:hypothetical protein [Actinomycetes bacterium]
MLSQLVQETWATWWAKVVAAGVPTDVAAIEQAVEGLVHQLGQQVVTAWAAAVVPTARPRCTVCQAPLRCVDPARAVTVTGIFGDYVLRRPYYVCPAGHGSASPADAAWGLGPERVTPTLAERLCRLAVETPFDRGARWRRRCWAWRSTERRSVGSRKGWGRWRRPPSTRRKRRGRRAGCRRRPGRGRRD